MAKHPDDRFPTARAVLEAIRSARAATAGVEDPVALLQRADESPTQAMPVARDARVRRRWLVGTAAAGLALAVLWVAGDQGGSERAGETDPESASGLVETAAARAPGPRAALVVENRLAEPIALSLADTSLTIAPGDRGRLTLQARQPVEASWAMVQPTAGDRVLGERVEGAILKDDAEGEMYHVVDAEAGGETRFTPLVVNEAGRPLTVAVVGPDDSLACDCRISSGDSLRLGYYRYSDATGLRVTDSRGWSARLGDLGTRRDPESGAVVVRVSRGDLQPPAGSSRRGKPARPRSAERTNPLSTFLPVQ
jgi:hypothetical protein